MTKLVLEPISDPSVAQLLNRLHRALRCVDSCDYTSPLPQNDMDTVSAAVQDLEQFCRERKVWLDEFPSFGERL